VAGIAHMCVWEATHARGSRGGRGVSFYMYIAPKDFLIDFLAPTEMLGVQIEIPSEELTKEGRSRPERMVLAGAYLKYTLKGAYFK
jgi:hypothetical protein